MYRKPTAPILHRKQTRFRARPRQRGVLAAAFLALAACSSPAPQVGEIGAVEGFLGAAITEEPRAALIARDALSAGGTAADAATAAYFAMTVTYPVAVGLGGGGVCLYYDHRTNKTETLDFRAGRAAAGGLIAVPGALRGMALLHSRYGRLPWAQLVAPAETLARFGHQISRAFARRLGPQAERLKKNSAAADIFLRADGQPLMEAETVKQVALASTLTRIRTKGVSDLYGGQAGRQMLQTSVDHGGKVTMGELRKFRAKWRETVARPIGNHILHHPQLGQNAGKAERLTDLMAKAPASAIQVFDPAELSGRVDRGEAAVVVGDSFGSSAACVFQMNGAFGSGVLVPNTGTFLAQGPVEGSFGDSGYPMPLLGVNENINQTVMAVAGSGGPHGALSGAAISLGVMDKDQPLNAAMAALDAAKAGGLVQALWCPGGIRRTPKSCQFATDPRAFGLAAFDRF